MADNLEGQKELLQDMIDISAGLPGGRTNPSMQGTVRGIFSDIVEAGKNVFRSDVRPGTMEEARIRLQKVVEQAELSGAVLPAGGIAPKALQMGGRFLRRALQRGGVAFRGAERAKPVRGRVVERLALPDPAALDRAEAVAGRMPYGELVRKELIRSFKKMGGE